jgi:hypothetical protein
MNLIQFPFTGGVVNYPDDPALFADTTNVPAISAIVADYSGAMNLTPYTGPWPIPAPPVYQTRMLPGELTGLLGTTPDSGKAGYRKIYQAAYPRGAAVSGETNTRVRARAIVDDTALLFFELLNRPPSADGLVDVLGDAVDEALAEFVTADYITQVDKDYVQLGIVS